MSFGLPNATTAEQQDMSAHQLAETRAEFLSTAGARLGALVQMVRSLERGSDTTRVRENLLRRVYAMGAASQVLKLDAFAEQLMLMHSYLKTGPEGETADWLEVLRSNLEAMRQVLDQERQLDSQAEPLLPEPESRGPESLSLPEPQLDDPALPEPVSAAVSANFVPAGPAPAPDAERQRPEAALQVIPCVTFVPKVPLAGLGASQHPGEPELVIHEAQSTEELTRVCNSLRPRVVVLDADHTDTDELLDTLQLDTDISSFSIVLVGSFDRPEAAASYAQRGAIQIVPKPISPRLMRQAILEAASQTPRAANCDLGQLTVGDLAAVISREVQRSLVEASSPEARRQAVALGKGDDVMSAVWSALAQVRDVVTLRSGGAVQFAKTGPESAIAVNPWGAEPRDGRGDRHAEQVSLEGRTVLVADDDPAIAWFFGSVLRPAGATVLEAHDGQRALELVHESWPDLVICDIVMPGLDGFSLCRAIKNDIALSDTPVVLISWKEDLLQRVRELGAGADGYLRKEATPKAVLRRLREMLHTRARIETRLSAPGVLQGRLDEVTPRLILELVCQRDDNVTLTVRDAVYLYEVEVRDGQIWSALRTTERGDLEHGEQVLGALLGVRAGRFTVTPGDARIERQFQGTLRELLAGPIQRSRVLMQALSGESLYEVEQVELDSLALEPYLLASPAPARRVCELLRAGHAPRRLLSQFPDLVEPLLQDLVRHGGVRAVRRSEASAVDEMAAAPPKLESPLGSEIADDEFSRARGTLRVSTSELRPEHASPSPSSTDAAEIVSRNFVTDDEPPTERDPQPEAPPTIEAVVNGAEAVEPAAFESSVGADATPEFQVSASIGDHDPSRDAVPIEEEACEDVSDALLDDSEGLGLGVEIVASEQAPDVLSEDSQELGAAVLGDLLATPDSSRAAPIARQTAPLRADSEGKPANLEPQAGATRRHAAPQADPIASKPKPLPRQPALASRRAREQADPGNEPRGDASSSGQLRHWASVALNSRKTSPAPSAVKQRPPRNFPAISLKGKQRVRLPKPRVIVAPTSNEPAQVSGGGLASSASNAATAAKRAAGEVADGMRERLHAAAHEVTRRLNFRKPSGASQAKLDALGRHLKTAAAPAGVALAAGLLAFGAMRVVTHWVNDTGPTGQIAQLDQVSALDADAVVDPSDLPRAEHREQEEAPSAATLALRAVEQAKTSQEDTDSETPARSVAPPDAKPTSTAPVPSITQNLPLPDGIQVNSGKGLLEVNTQGRQKIYVGDVFVGRGPVRRMALAAGTHQLRVSAEGKQLEFEAPVTAAKRTRVELPAPARTAQRSQ